MTTETTTRNPFAERHAIRADMVNARVAHDTLRGKLAEVGTAKKAAVEEAFKEEMEAVVGGEGAAKRRDAALERIAGYEGAEVAYKRGFEAAEQIIKVREGELARLHDDDEAFEAFVREADNYAAAAVRDLQEVGRAVVKASQSWSKATALWRPLSPALRRRLDELSAQEGVYGNNAAQSVVPPFPVSLPSDLASVAPRPRGIERLKPE